MPFARMPMKWNNLYISAESKQFLCSKAEADTAGQNQRLKNNNNGGSTQELEEEKNSTKFHCKLSQLKGKYPPCVNQQIQMATIILINNSKILKFCSPVTNKAKKLIFKNRSSLSSPCNSDRSIKLADLKGKGLSKLLFAHSYAQKITSNEIQQNHIMLKTQVNLINNFCQCKNRL